MSFEKLGEVTDGAGESGHEREGEWVREVRGRKGPNTHEVLIDNRKA